MQYISKFIFFIIISLTHLSVFAQERSVEGLTDYSGTWWFNAGAGIGNIFGIQDDSIDEEDQDNTGPAGTISFNYAVTDNQLLTLRTSVVNVDWVDFLGSNSEVKHINNVYDFAVLYGLMHKSDVFLASISAGVAYTAIEYNMLESFDYDENDHLISGHYGDHVESTIGLPLEAQLFWTPTSFIGLGLIGLANINSEASYVAGLVAVQVGDLR